MCPMLRIGIVRERKSQEVRQKEKNERTLFSKEVQNNTETIKKVSEDLDKRTANMEKKIAKIEGNISTILELLQK